MSGPPVAIIGRGCVLPGAASPAELWEQVVAGRSALSTADREVWRADPAAFLAGGTRPEPDKTWTLRGGYVRGFDAQFDPAGFRLPASEIPPADTPLRWLLHCGRQALTEAGFSADEDLPRAGLVTGNLSYPTDGQTAFVESVWLSRSGIGAATDRSRERFSSGLPAALAARGLGCTQGGFALDAACASSLYAIKIACDRLVERRTDLMLAGAVNAADPLFLNLGFTALGALSRSGQSRPFHREADGLLPAVGAVLLLLCRLEDALAAGRPVLAVIRGVGLSNDGAGGALLSPDPEGQVRAMHGAYRQSAIAPSEISLVECHATGTPVGDRAELASMAQVFADSRPSRGAVPIGSLKGNMGHLLAAAGGAAILKVIGAMEAGIRPPTLGAGEPAPELVNSPFRLLQEAEPWECDGPRRAAVSAFGFGGNNAHLILEEWRPGARPPAAAIPGLKPPTRSPASGTLAIVSLAVRAGDKHAGFLQRLFGEPGAPEMLPGSGAGFPAGPLTLALDDLRMPPAEAAETSGQQLLFHAAAVEAMARVSLPPARTGVYAGIGCDPEVARYGGRIRLSQWLPGAPPEARDAVAPPLTAGRVKGTMPNFPANRLSRRFDLRGPGFTVSAEEGSGLVALELARDALAAGEIDAALVGAVDLSCEPAHQAAALVLLPPERQLPGDVAVAMVVMRLADAHAADIPVLALLPEEETPAESAESEGISSSPGSEADIPEPLELTLGPEQPGLTARFGHAHAASGLLLLAAAAVACAHAAEPAPEQPARPWLAPAGRRRAVVRVTALGGQQHTARVTALPGALARPLPATAVLALYAAASREELIRRLDGDARGGDGPVRLALAAADPEEAERKREAALRTLRAGHPPAAGSGISFAERPVSGQIAWVFTGGAAGYSGMGRELLLAFPQLWESFAGVTRRFPEIAVTLWPPDDHLPSRADPTLRSLAMCQFHAEFSRQLLNIRPDATLGLSSGEIAALFAIGAWEDSDSLFEDLVNSGVLEMELGGEWRSVRRHWERTGLLQPEQPLEYRTWQVKHPVDRVLAAVEGTPRVHVTVVLGPDECAIGGQAADCRKLIAGLGAMAQPLGSDMAIHCPEAGEAAETWRRIHDRPTSPVPGVRCYTNADNSSYTPERARIAATYTQQAVQRIDFPATVRRAWEEGVRVFIEHGPRGVLTPSIDRILGAREHLAVALDRSGRPPVLTALEAAARLWCAGAADPTPLLDLLERARCPAAITSSHQENGQERASEAGGRRAITLATRVPAGRIVGTGREGAHEEKPAVSSPRPGTGLPPPAIGIDPAPVTRMPRAPELPPVLTLWTASGISGLSGSSCPIPGGTLALPCVPETEPGEAEPVREGASRASETGGRLELPVAVHRTWLAGMARDHAAFLQTFGRLAGLTGAGVSFSRAQLEILAAGKVSDVFGPLFVPQDGYPVQVRMPMPPLLLADRVTRIDAEPGVLGSGMIDTETDVTPGGWYLHHGRMPAGLMIEAGQADLLLISWMGIDLHLKGQRVYRLLGCDLTFHGPLARPGETLSYQIRIDGHARHGDIRLFFFQYDCFVGDELRMTVRNGQAGFFTPEELAASQGILGEVGTDPLDRSARVDPPRAAAVKASLSRTDLERFASGDAYGCFGKGYERAACHTRTPCISGGRMLLLHRVTHLDPRGGAEAELGAERGYLRAETDVRPDDWFFAPHFKGDPCMPGTLMFEGCVQALSVYAAALGLTLDRDGWRFEPVTGRTLTMRCRGQVVPASRRIVYELFVRSVIDDETPIVIADALVTVDGVKAFHCQGLALRLVPGWPVEATEEQRAGGHAAERPFAASGDVRGDREAMLACALGRPSAAFGAMYRRFDGPGAVPRLPGPPYLCISRITAMPAEPGQMQARVSAEAEFDVDPDAWYFAANGDPVMPFAVLLELALQPCGWLASFVGCVAHSTESLRFRNLDGSAQLFSEVGPEDGRLRTRATLTRLSRLGATILTGFEVECRVGERLVLRLDTVFGFFPPAALANQVGLPPGPAAIDLFSRHGGAPIDLRAPAGAHAAVPCFARGMLLMLDRITGWWPTGGRAGQGAARGEMDVDPTAWFFKAHFFQDPVQPGSLGLEAMLQLLQLHMLQAGMHHGISLPRFQAILAPPGEDRGGATIGWKYRGQVLPTDGRVTVTAEINAAGRDEEGPYALADASLWVDGRHIYHATGLGMRIVSSGVSGQADVRL